MRRRIAILLCLIGASSACTTARRPVTPLPESIADTTRPYWLHVERRVDPQRQFALLAAERYAPPADSVRAAAARARRFDKSKISGGQWWYDSFDGTRIPYALTGDAVRYYVALLNDLAQHQGVGAGHPPMASAAFSYRATVTAADSLPAAGNRPREGYVVDLSMQWSQWCGDVCALTLEKKRRVWVANDGRVLAVEGDGLTQYVVSQRLSPREVAWLAHAPRPCDRYRLNLRSSSRRVPATLSIIASSRRSPTGAQSQPR